MNAVIMNGSTHCHTGCGRVPLSDSLLSTPAVLSSPRHVRCQSILSKRNSSFHRVLPTGHDYFLSKILFTPVNGAEQLVAAEVHAEDEYDRLTAAFASQQWSYAKLRFDVYDETPHKSVEKAVVSSTSQRVAPTGNKSVVPSTTAATVARGTSVCCATHQGKKEIESLLSKFMTDFGSVMSSTFGDEMSPVLEAQATPRLPNSEASRSTTPDRAVDDIHPRVSCNYCGGQVRGIRYKCNQCADYDLVCLVVVLRVPLSHTVQVRRLRFKATRKGSPYIQLRAGSLLLYYSATRYCTRNFKCRGTGTGGTHWSHL